MAKIYISSTYEDLKDHREAVYNTLRRWQHNAIAMEDYVASDQRPLDKCLDDISQCDVYIGIFAWRYGYIPPGQVKSITVLEYECAIKSGIPCRIFILDEDMLWKPCYIDEDQSNIKEFRKKLQETHTVKFFKTVDNLKAHVSESLKDISSKNRKRASNLIYYNMDRYEQIELMDIWLKKFASNNPSPHFAWIFHGKYHHEPNRFLGIMKNKWSNQKTKINFRFYENLKWPHTDTLDQDFELSILSKIHDQASEELSIQSDFTFETISKELNKHKGALVFNFKVHSYQLKNCKQDISNFLNIFSKWPERHHGPLIVMLTIVYVQASSSQKTQKRGFTNWLKRSPPVNEPDTCIRDALQNLSLNQFNFTKAFVFKEFSLITYSHAQDWLENHFDSNMDEYYVLDRIIEDLYTPRDKTYPLKELAQVIKQRFEKGS